MLADQVISSALVKSSSGFDNKCKVSDTSDITSAPEPRWVRISTHVCVVFAFRREKVAGSSAIVLGMITELNAAGIISYKIKNKKSVFTVGIHRQK